jgi:hypothetical protein
MRTGGGFMTGAANLAGHIAARPDMSMHPSLTASLPPATHAGMRKQHVLSGRRRRVRHQLLPLGLLLQQHVQHVLPGEGGWRPHCMQGRILGIGK